MLFLEGSRLRVLELGYKCVEILFGVGSENFLIKCNIPPHPILSIEAPATLCIFLVTPIRKTTNIECFLWKPYTHLPGCLYEDSIP